MLSIAHKIVTEGGGQLFVSFTFQPDEILEDNHDLIAKGDESASGVETRGVASEVPGMEQGASASVRSSM